MKIILPIYFTKKYKTKKDKVFLVNMNGYRNAHYILSNEVKSFYHKLVASQVKKPIKGQIWLHRAIYIKRKGTDGDGIDSVLRKFVLDGLVENKMIPDDNIDFVKGGSDEYFYDKENPRIEIEIIVK